MKFYPRVYLYHSNVDLVIPGVIELEPLQHPNDPRMVCTRTRLVIAGKEIVPYHKPCPGLIDDNCDRKRVLGQEELEIVDLRENLFRTKNGLLHCEYDYAYVSADHNIREYWLRGNYFDQESWFAKVKGNEYWPYIMGRMLGSRIEEDFDGIL